MKRVLVFLPGFFTACSLSNTTVDKLVGDPTGGATTQLIGASGGTVTSPNGDLTVQVPAGAVSADVTLSLTPITSKATGALGQAWRLGPEGTTFAKAVTLSFRYDDTMLSGAAPERILVAFQSSDHTWTSSAPTSLNKASKTVSFESEHLRDWSLVLKADGSPGTTRLSIRGSFGGTVALAGGYVTSQVADGVSFTVSYPLGLGVYGEAPAGVNVKGPIGPEFNLEEEQARVTSSTDERSGCPSPTLQGAVELMTMKRLTLGANAITIIGRDSLPPVEIGLGESQCEGGTQVVNGSQADVKYELRLTPSQWALARTQAVTLEVKNWHWSIGP